MGGGQSQFFKNLIRQDKITLNMDLKYNLSKTDF